MLNIFSVVLLLLSVYHLHAIVHGTVTTMYTSITHHFENHFTLSNSSINKKRFNIRSRQLVVTNQSIVYTMPFICREKFTTIQTSNIITKKARY